MPIRNIPPQNHFLYSDGWTGELDSYYISLLVRYKNSIEQWTGKTPPRVVFGLCRKAIEERYGIEVASVDLQTRLQFLYKRYKCFNWVRKFGSAIFLEADNKIHATTPTWLSIFRRDDFAKAYYFEADPEWRNLLILFGPEEIKQEGQENVVILSETTQELDFDEQEESGEASVTSPAPGNTNEASGSGYQGRTRAPRATYNRDSVSYSSSASTSPRPWM